MPAEASPADALEQMLRTAGQNSPLMPMIAL
jgi:hypothetical protein